MEFTKGMTVRSKYNDMIIAVTEDGDRVFSGVVIHARGGGYYCVGDYSDGWDVSAFHPCDLQSAIEEALKITNHE